MSDRIDSELPCGWELQLLDDVAQVNPPLDRCILNDDVPVTFVPMRAVEAEGGGIKTPEIRPYGEVKRGYTAFLSGDVITAKITPCMENGKTAVVPNVEGDVCFGSTEFHVIRPEVGIASRWIEQFLLQHETRREAQRQMSGGVGQMRVPAEFLKIVRIPISPLAEQVRIADTLDELFSNLDAGVAALKRARDRLQRYRASVLKAAVEGTLTADWRKQHANTEPASELLKRVLAERRRRWEEDQLRKFEEKSKAPPKNWKAKYKEPVVPDTASLPALPEGWCWATFAELASQRLGKMLDKAKNVERLRPYLRNVNTRWFSFDLDDLAEMRISDEEFPNVSVGFGDLVVCEGGEPGHCAVWNRKNDSIAIQKALHRIRPGCGVSSHYLSFVLAAGTYNGKLKKAFTRTGINHLTGESLASYPVPLPPSTEQESIVGAMNHQLSIIEELEVDVETRLQSARTLRQSILKHAFAGKLVPQDPNDEPAAELLKRIAAERAARTRKTAAAKGSGSARRRRSHSKPK